VNLTSSPLLFPSSCVPIKILCANLRCSEKTARKIAGKIPGARFELGGRVYFDQAMIAESYRGLPCSPVPDSGAMGDNEVSDEDSHE
jgi:hypothetical protein